MKLPSRGAGESDRSRPEWLRRSVAGLAVGALSLGLAVAGAPAARAAEAFFCADGTQPYVPVAEAEAFAPGEAVTGLSVTSGTTPDEFSGSYVGFIDNALGKDRDLLLFRLSSPVIDGTEAGGGLKGAGIWAGMSGSPVYTTDGRLIGAVAYSLNYENLPIAGVTPAEYLKAIGTTAVSGAARVRVTSANLKASPSAVAAVGSTLVGSTLAPIRTVNVAGGAQKAFTNRTLARTPRTAKSAGLLRSGSFLPAAAVAPAAVSEPLVPGGNVVAAYASGDVIAGAIGTVTAVCGDTVWAFGHPMAHEGRAQLLLANASAAMIVPDAAGLYGSYKQVSQFGAPLGMITEDRLAGIRGTVGEVATWGIDVTVQDPAGRSVAGYHVDVAEPDAGASMAALVTGQAAYEQLDQFGAGTAEVTWTIDYRREDGSTGSLTNFQVVADRSYFPDLVATPVADDIWAITDNDVEDVRVTGVQVTLKLLDASAVTHKVNDVQVMGRAGWKSLSGTRLKAGRTYEFRPAYRVVRDGKPKATAFGEPVQVKLSAKARRSGSFLVAAANSADPCEADPSGFADCEDWDAEAYEYADFDELVATLDDLQPENLVLGSLRYRLQKGSRSRYFEWTAPGVVFGSARVDFAIRR